MELQVRYLVLFPLSSVIDDFRWFWMGILHKNIQFMLEFLKALFLDLHFSYYTLVTFLVMLSVILLSMLMILLCSKCDQVSGLWQQLELAFELESDWSTRHCRKWQESGFLILMMEKPNWFRVTGLITLVLFIWKWMGQFLRKNDLWKCWSWLSPLNWIGVKTASKKIGALIHSVKVSFSWGCSLSL